MQCGNRLTEYQLQCKNEHIKGQLYIRSSANNSKLFLTQISVINNFHYLFAGLNFDDLFFLSYFIFGTVFDLQLLRNRYLKIFFSAVKGTNEVDMKFYLCVGGL